MLRKHTANAALHCISPHNAQSASRRQQRDISKNAALYVLLMLFLASGLGSAAAQPSKIIPEGSEILLVRHADRLPGPANDDTPITERGRRRANALAAHLQGRGITAIVTSNAKRTIETACPTANALKLALKSVPREHVAAEVRRALPGKILVVGHSETLPALASNLGGKRLKQPIGFGQLFALKPQGSGKILDPEDYTFRNESGKEPECRSQVDPEAR